MHQFQSIVKPLGHLPIPVGHGKVFDIMGGPFEAFTPIDDSDYGVCLEVRSSNVDDASVALSIPDFSTPDPQQLDVVCRDIVNAMYRGKQVYIGCMAGRDRTGTVMACLVKQFGIEDPIGYVRRYYSHHAVETKKQEAFVQETTLPLTRSAIRKHRFFGIFRR